MNDIFGNDFKNKTFNQNDNHSPLLKIKYYNPPNLVFQHLPFKEKNKNIEIKSMRSRYSIDTLTSVDICEIIKMDGKVNRIYEGVIDQENLKLSLFR